MALGARRSTVIGMVMSAVLLQGLLGLVLGGLAAAAVGRIIANQLYGVSATDPTNAVLAVAGLVACVALAGFILSWTLSGFPSGKLMGGGSGAWGRLLPL